MIVAILADTLHMPDTSLRKIEMLRLIPRRAPGISCRQIGEKLEARGFSVDMRTIQRDLAALSAVFPLVSDECRPARWWWMENGGGFGIPGHDAFSALTWKLVGDHLAPLLPQPLLREISPDLATAERYLESEGGEKLNRWHARVRMLPNSFRLAPPRIERNVPEAVYGALFESRKLAIEYRSRGEPAAKSRTVNPLALVVRDAVYYLLATIDPYSDVRQLVLHRMQRAERLDEAVAEPAGFDLDDYIAAGEFAYGPGRPIRLVARFEKYAAQHLLESPLADDQVANKLDDERIEIAATVQETSQLFWWLMGFGSNVEVVEPAPLRDEIKTEIFNLNERYKGS